MNLVKKLLIVPTLMLVSMLQVSNALGVDLSREHANSRNRLANYIAPELSNNVRTRTVYSEKFNDVWDAILINVDEDEYNLVYINEAEGQLVVDKYSEFDHDLDCGTYESRRDRVITEDVITTYSYQLTRLGKRKTSLTLDVDGSASWKIDGRNNRYTTSKGINDSLCVSVGSYENQLFNTLGQKINQVKNQARLDKKQKNWKQNRRDRLARIETRRLQENNYRQNESRQQRDSRRQQAMVKHRERRRLGSVPQRRDSRREEAAVPQRAVRRQEAAVPQRDARRQEAVVPQRDARRLEAEEGEADQQRNERR